MEVMFGGTFTRSLWLRMVRFFLFSNILEEYGLSGAWFEPKMLDFVVKSRKCKEHKVNEL